MTTTTRRLGQAFFACLLLSAAQLAAAQAPPARQDAPRPAAAGKAEYPSLKTQAEALSEAFLAGDYEKVAALTHPRVVQIAGGAEALVNHVRQGMREAEADGMKVLSYTVGEPGPATRIGDRLYAIVPSLMKMQIPQGVAAQESFMIGVSGDGGESWTFVGGTGTGDKEMFRMVLPEAAGKLKLPEVKPPTFERKQ